MREGLLYVWFVEFQKDELVVKLNVEWGFSVGFFWLIRTD